MATTPAAPSSSGAGSKSLPHRILHTSLRRHSREPLPPTGRTRELPAGGSADQQPKTGVGERLFGWARFPDAVIKLALTSPASVQSPEAEPVQAPADTASEATTTAPAPAPAPAPAGKKSPARPRPAAKTPPRPDHRPSPVAVSAPAPRITDRKSRRRAPLQVNLAALLITGGGVLTLLIGLRKAMDPQRAAPAAASQLEALGLPAETVLSMARVADVAVAVVAFGFYVLLASLIRDGRNWARAGCFVLVAAALFFGFKDLAYQHVTAGVLAGLGTGLLFIPQSARYFASRGNRRVQA